jgi:hypothetical protein
MHSNSRAASLRGQGIRLVTARRLPLCEQFRFEHRLGLVKPAPPWNSREGLTKIRHIYFAHYGCLFRVLSPKYSRAQSACETKLSLRSSLSKAREG